MTMKMNTISKRKKKPQTFHEQKPKFPGKIKDKEKRIHRRTQLIKEQKQLNR